MCKLSDKRIEDVENFLGESHTQEMLRKYWQGPQSVFGLNINNPILTDI